MKTYFAEYNWGIRQAAKKIGITVDQLIANWGKTDRRRTYENNDDVRENLVQIEIAAWRNGITHYFIETELLAERMEGFATKLDGTMLDYIQQNEFRSGIIHTCGKMATAFLFFFDADRIYIRSTNDTMCTFTKENISGLEPSKASRFINLFFGFALYAQCFPHAIIPGFPEEGKHPAHYRGQKCVAVRCAPEIRDHSSPMPHPRKGHPRYFSDSRFTKMRFKTIWIDQTFVRGDSKTVLENP